MRAKNNSRPVTGFRPTTVLPWVTTLTTFLLLLSWVPLNAAAPSQTGGASLVKIADRTMTLSYNSWDLNSGLALYGLLRTYETTGDQRYLDFVHNWFDASLAQGPALPSSIPSTAPGIALLELYRLTGAARYLEAARLQADYLVERAPLQSDGGLVYVNDRLQVETVFVASTLLSHMGTITGESRYFETAVNQFLIHQRRLMDPYIGLYYHTWDQSTDTNLSAAFWARGNGLAILGATELLENLPVTNSNWPIIHQLLRRHIAALVERQPQTGSGAGLWPTVIDHPGYYNETSATAGIGAGLAIALSHGWESPELGANMLTARTAVLNQVANDGTVLNVSADTPVQPAVANYNTIPHTAVQGWGQGLALLFLTAPTYNFEAQFSPSPIFVIAGSTGYGQLQAATLYGQLPLLHASIEAGIPGFTVAVDPAILNPSESARIAISLPANPAIAGGTYPFTATLSSGAITQTVPFEVRYASEVEHVYLPLVSRNR
ncbi:MAG: hypothetical protein EXR62_05785 [Chloroflexi bacterium]|nr:hypothetical protein [Chloroflexota bacterium]